MRTIQKLPRIISLCVGILLWRCAPANLTPFLEPVISPTYMAIIPPTIHSLQGSPIPISTPETSPTSSPTPTDIPIQDLYPNLPKGEYVVTQAERELIIRNIDGELIGKIGKLRGVTPGSLMPGSDQLLTYLPTVSIFNITEGISKRQGYAFGGGFPWWSPDSERFVFVQVGNDDWGSIYIADVMDEKSWAITFWDTGELDPAWSPDGKWIVFATDHFRQDYPGTYDLYLYDASCIDQPSSCITRIRQLTFVESYDAAISPAWSPDSQEIVHSCYIDHEPGLCVLDVSSLEVEKITKGDHRNPGWSPGGEWIAYTRTLDYPPFVEVHLVKPDGTNNQKVIGNESEQFAFWLVVQ